MIKIACIQPEVLYTIKSCYSEIERLLKLLVEEETNCDLICFPERCFPLYKDMKSNFQKERGEIYGFMKRMSVDYNISIITGAMWEKRRSSKMPKITCYYFNEFGDEIGRQDKIHLYSYERELFKSGNTINIFPLKDYFFAILICFDMAFFETPRLASVNGANILISPTQIRLEGMENWNIYLRARALENRIPIIGCNTYGEIFKRKFTGESKIISFMEDFISPSKLKIVEGPSNSSGYISDVIDLDFPNKLRRIRFNEIIKSDQIKIRKVENKRS